MYLLVLLLCPCGSGFSSIDRPPQDCLSNEPATVTLKGTFSRKTFPGPPNFESVKKGDWPKRYWILHLTQLVCVNSGAEGAPDNVNEPEKNISDLQLDLREEQYARHRELLNKRAVVTGKLFHSITGHHHTKVLMDVTEINGLKARATTRIVVPITNESGVKLRRSPSTNAKVIGRLGVGDEVEVIRKAEGDPGKGDAGLWTFVKPVRSARGAFDLDSGQPGWVLDRDLGYTDRFKKITSWKKQSINAEIGDYAFTIDIRTDGSFTHRSSPCVDCGEKPECNKGETKVGGECVSRGHLYRYDNFVWARKPTKYQEYFFIDGKGKLRSVYE